MHILNKQETPSEVSSNLMAGVRCEMNITAVSHSGSCWFRSWSKFLLLFNMFAILSILAGKYQDITLR